MGREGIRRRTLQGRVSSEVLDLRRPVVELGLAFLVALPQEAGVLTAEIAFGRGCLPLG
jgi:hypothetical protein